MTTPLGPLTDSLVQNLKQVKHRPELHRLWQKVVNAFTAAKLSKVATAAVRVHANLRRYVACSYSGDGIESIPFRIAKVDIHNHKIRRTRL